MERITSDLCTQGDAGAGLGEVLSTVAVPYYAADDSAFHAASMAQLLRRLGKPPPAALGAEALAPAADAAAQAKTRVWLLHSEAGKTQSQAIRDQIEQRWPAFRGNIHDWPHPEPGGPASSVQDGDAVLVYLTEGVCSAPGVLQRIESVAGRAGRVTVVWVAETDWEVMAEVAIGETVILMTPPVYPY